MRHASSLLLALAVLLSACRSATLSGTDLGKQPAPDFTLIDGPTGQVVSLSSLRSKVVVLSFLYTACPDTCPLTAEKLRNARDTLGTERVDLALLAVSVAPDRDTPSATRVFLADHRLTGAMRFLIGDRASLAAVWARYGIYAEPQGQGFVAHIDAIFLIDRQGRARALEHSDVEVDTLVQDLRILLGESRLF